MSGDNSPFHGGTSFESIKSKKLSCKSDALSRVTLLSMTLATSCVDKFDQCFRSNVRMGKKPHT